ncbi:cytochrome o ubiquinol oxidase subunit IV [uncultured Sphingomonas sp.]|uniref:cytochrome o ubiquinol oxidase subunit IV n=1 Tax=uncultured Sphingomonas sp. TaxID=158754 RepID=UPI0025F2A056|nr:cytochrome o ubiquinol oxidase subunit IV [uncultured Sphingomonas sp.]
MSDATSRDPSAPGESQEQEQEEAGGGGWGVYILGFVIALLLTGATFVVALTGLVWAPARPVAIVVLAVAQMGVHLVFFLHLTSGPDNRSNAVTVAFGAFVCLLVVFGSVWIMTHLSHSTHSPAAHRGM